jgi:hypothetical protein
VRPARFSSMRKYCSRPVHHAEVHFVNRTLKALNQIVMVTQMTSALRAQRYCPEAHLGARATCAVQYLSPVACGSITHLPGSRGQYHQSSAHPGKGAVHEPSPTISAGGLMGVVPLMKWPLPWSLCSAITTLTQQRPHYPATTTVIHAIRFERFGSALVLCLHRHILRIAYLDAERLICAAGL